MLTYHIIIIRYTSDFIVQEDADELLSSEDTEILDYLGEGHDKIGNLALRK